MKTRSRCALLALRPSDAFTATLSADYTRQTMRSRRGIRRRPDPHRPGVRTCRCTSPIRLRLPHPHLLPPRSGQEMTHKGVSANLQWDFAGHGDRKASPPGAADKLLHRHRRVRRGAPTLVEVDQSSSVRSCSCSMTMAAPCRRSSAPLHAGGAAVVPGGARAILRLAGDDLVPAHDRRRPDTTSVAAFAHVTWEFVPT